MSNKPLVLSVDQEHNLVLAELADLTQKYNTTVVFSTLIGFIANMARQMIANKIMSANQIKGLYGVSLAQAFTIEDGT